MRHPLDNWPGARPPKAKVASTPDEDPRESDDDQDDIVDDIMEVWGDYDDFDSPDYIAWVMEKNAEELREARNWTEYENELADQAICSLRALAELPQDENSPQDIIRRRLRERMDGNQEEIIETYKEVYNEFDR